MHLSIVLLVLQLLPQRYCVVVVLLHEVVLLLWMWLLAFHLENIMLFLSFQGDLDKTDEYASKRKSDCGINPDILFFCAHNINANGA